MHKSEGLIKNSASFKSPQIFHTSLAHLAHDHKGLQIARTLFIYLFNYLIIYFRLVVYIVTCTVYIILYYLLYITMVNCNLHCIYIYIYHYHHHDHHSTNYNASIQYMCHCLRKNTTTTAITQCKLQYYGQPPLPPPPPPRPPQHKLQCMHSVYASLL